MADFKFTNISTAVPTTANFVASKEISPVLQPTDSSVPNYFNGVEAAMLDAATGLVAVKIPIYGRAQYATVLPGAANALTITATDSVIIAWYRDLVKAYAGSAFVTAEEL